MNTLKICTNIKTWIVYYKLKMWKTMSDVLNTQWTATHKNDTHSTDDKMLTAAKLHLGSL